MTIINRRSAVGPNVFIVAMLASTKMLSAACAFIAVDTPTPSFLSTTRPRRHVKISTTLLLSSADKPDQEMKLTIATITDENSHIHLHPPSNRPVLVDAFAPFCGPCKLLDKVLRKAQPTYLEKVDFCRWNVNDKEATIELKQMFLDSGYTLTKLPSLILFRDGKPIAVRPGFANEFQLDDWLEKELPDVLERTFDENGIKMIPMVAKGDEKVVTHKTHVVKEEKALLKASEQDEDPMDCQDPEACWERVENTIWQNRTVVPAMEGIFLPRRSMSYSS